MTEQSAVERQLAALLTKVQADPADRKSPLHVAAEAGHVQIIQFLCQQEQEHTGDIQASDAQGCTPLHLACRQGHVDAALALLQAGADVNACDDAWQTPLHEASKAGHLSIFRVLVREGAEVRMVDLQGQTVVQFICTEGHVNLLEYLIQEGYSDLLQTPSGADQRLPLHHAARAGQTKIVERLLDHLDATDAIVATDSQGKTAQHYACEMGHIAVLESLWKHHDHGASAFHVLDRKGHSPLHTAVAHDQINVVKWMLWQFVSVDQNNNPLARTPLQIACQRGSLEMVQCLIQEGGADTSKRDRQGNTALHHACARGHLNIVQWMIQCWMVHYRQDAVNHQGASCLHVAAREGQLATVQWLVQVAHVDVDAVDHAGRTPLHMAAQRCQIEVLTWLVKHGGADANAVDEAGCKARHYLQSAQTTVQRMATNMIGNTDVQRASSSAAKSTHKSFSGDGSHIAFANPLKPKRTVVSA